MVATRSIINDSIPMTINGQIDVPMIRDKFKNNKVSITRPHMKIDILYSKNPYIRTKI